jgi:hypothetical protein
MDEFFRDMDEWGLRWKTGFPRLMADAIRERREALLETMAAIERGIARINEMAEERQAREEADRG